VRVSKAYAGVLIAAAALLLGAMAPLGSPAQMSPPPSPESPPNQIASVTLARGVQADTLFGQGLIAPINPATSFINTDVPYAIVRVTNLGADAKVSFDLADPSGPAYTVEAKVPVHRGNPEQFDFAAPLYILGTDFETHLGAWHLKVKSIDGPQYSVTFQWTQATVLELSRIKQAIDDDPAKPDLHWRYGAALALFGHTREAIQELQDAIHLDPRYALYHVTLGRVYERQGRHGDAVREFQVALALHGSFYDAVFSGWAQTHLAQLQHQ
jgi:hypothetical protein